MICAGLSEDAVKMLIEQRQILGIGLDTPSVDPGSSKVSIISTSKRLNQKIELLFFTVICCSCPIGKRTSLQSRKCC